MAITRTDAEKANPLKIGMDALGWVGEKQDQLDKAVGIGKFNVYNARHLLIDPVTKVATRLHPAAGVAANVGMEMLVPDSTLYAGKILKGIRGISKVIKGTRPAYAIAGATGDVGRVSNVKISKSPQSLMIKGDGSWAGRGQPPTNQTANKLWRLEGEITDNIKAKEIDPRYTPANIEKGLPDDVSKVPIRKQPKVSALGRYDEFTQQGYELSESIAKQAEAIRKPDYGKQLKGLTQWTDKAAYKKAAQEAYDTGTSSKDIRTKIGVYVDPKSGEVFQMKSRSAGPKLSLRSWSEQANTTLNRTLSRAQQQAVNVVAHDSPKNVSILMKRMNFKGTAKEFTSKYAIHHKRSIVAYEPFFHKLGGKEAKQLRELIEADGIKLGDNIENLVAIPKKMHTLDKKSIHTLMRKNGIEGVSKDWDGIVGSYDAQASLRKRFAKASVPQRYKAFKLYQEYVQNPTDDMLNKILAAMD